jgi:hypothetical protein
MPNCPYHDAPAACVKKRLREFQEQDPSKRPHRRVECDNCKAGYANAEKMHVPEPDIEPTRHRASRMNGPPCPVCGRGRPKRSSIKADKPCADCILKDPEYILATRLRKREWDRANASKRHGRYGRRKN